jgi:hypothetical protein
VDMFLSLTDALADRIPVEFATSCLENASRLPHFPADWRCLAEIELRSGLRLLAGEHRLSYINDIRARQTGTNRATR